MEKFTEILKILDYENLTQEQLLAILDICSNKIDILTISNMARKENKTPTGIRTSNQYRKIEIGGQLMAVKGIKESNLPF
jgi:hypothetical protein